MRESTPTATWGRDALCRDLATWTPALIADADLGDAAAAAEHEAGRYPVGSPEAQLWLARRDAIEDEEERRF